MGTESLKGALLFGASNKKVLSGRREFSPQNRHPGAVMVIVIVVAILVVIGSVWYLIGKPKDTTEWKLIETWTGTIEPIAQPKENAQTRENIVIEFLKNTDVPNGGWDNSIEIKSYDHELVTWVLVGDFITSSGGHPGFFLTAVEDHTAQITLNESGEVVSAFCVQGSFHGENKVWDLLAQRWIEPERWTGPIFIQLKAATFDPLIGEPELPQNLKIDSYPTGVDGHYLVQFIGPIIAEWKEQIVDLGGTFHGSISQYAFDVKMSAATKANIENLGVVRWVGILQPAYKIHPVLFMYNENYVTVNVLLYHGADLAGITSEINLLGGEILDAVDISIGGLIRVRMNAARIPEVAQIYDVKWIEPWVQPVVFTTTSRFEQ